MSYVAPAAYFPELPRVSFHLMLSVEGWEVYQMVSKVTAGWDWVWSGGRAGGGQERSGCLWGKGGPARGGCFSGVSPGWIDWSQEG